ncbi:hypothetical protein [Streptomyces sp. ISL-11]|uniref:hypothetical protein n=1 Tax=Streptomyces sp. ISL-11 TaxID=2819174 RepID=UPI001BEB770E|nr:hypothetical protein [Streptomyces sp. ISL-11]MBT2383119.1 hypothetical protein [Streptomyces sp. ISL-11]
MKANRTMALTALGAAVVLGTAGYLTSGGKEKEEIERTESVVDISRAAEDGHLRLPVEAYLPDKAQRELLRRARQKAVEQCMKDKGFSCRAPSATSLPDDSTGNLTDGRYGIHDRAKAAKFGYHPDPKLQEQRAKVMDASSKSLTGSSERERRALMGSAPAKNDGCIQEVKQRFAGASAQNSPAMKIANQAYDQAKADRRVKHAFSGWEACMRHQGYSYGEPMQANDDSKFATRSPTEQEIQVAVTDVDCRLQNEVNKIWYQTENEYQKRLIGKNSGELETARRDVARSLSEARSLAKG